MGNNRLYSSLLLLLLMDEVTPTTNSLRMLASAWCMGTKTHLHSSLWWFIPSRQSVPSPIKQSFQSMLVHNVSPHLKNMYHW